MSGQPETPPSPPSVESLLEVAWWMFDRVCVGMGAERHFDYSYGETEISERLGNCYLLSARSFGGWLVLGAEDTDLPAPVGLIHGTWHGPGVPKRINHAWVVLEDGRIWEPVTALICDPTLFYAYTNAEPCRYYSAEQTQIEMVRSGHYGPWVSGNRDQ